MLSCTRSCFRCFCFVVGWLAGLSFIRALLRVHIYYAHVAPPYARCWVSSIIMLYWDITNNNGFASIVIAWYSVPLLSYILLLVCTGTQQACLPKKLPRFASGTRHSAACFVYDGRASVCISSKS